MGHRWLRRHRERSVSAPALDLPSGHGLKVKLKALQVNDQRVRQDLYAIPLYCINLQAACHVLNAACVRTNSVLKGEQHSASYNSSILDLHAY